ncbi:MAG: hypothetical protein AB7E10_03385 [Burkholderiaceae bacterium]|jgi:hypothetical protein|uniref:hypothetical protein n=1 Tax=Extensimonas perlucida TaxID=2590786 RepID=UPI0016435979|nr:hypothetical protein [Extensimonas perlucida]MBC7215512.1 hypothetical protein [Burkholderiaceae bacterium]
MNEMRLRRDPTETRQRPWWRWLAWGLVCLALLAAFAGYTNPDFMVLLANQVWACF